MGNAGNEKPPPWKSGAPPACVASARPCRAASGLLLFKRPALPQGPRKTWVQSSAPNQQCAHHGSAPLPGLRFPIHDMGRAVVRLCCAQGRLHSPRHPHPPQAESPVIFQLSSGPEGHPLGSQRLPAGRVWQTTDVSRLLAQMRNGGSGGRGWPLVSAVLMPRAQAPAQQEPFMLYSQSPYLSYGTTL